MNNSARLRALTAATLLLAAGLCHAQYAWIDEKGVRQFSDRPPPPSTPLKNILRQPGGVPDSPDTPTPAQTPGADDIANQKPKGPPTLAERDLDYAKRSKANAERERNDAEDAARKSDLKENCDNALSAKAQLESGVRITTTEKNGERGYLSDTERALRLQKANKAVADCRP